MKNIKKYTIFAGVNGAGKSTLFQGCMESDLGVRLNTDEMIHEAKLDWKDPNVQMRVGKVMLDKQKECIEKGITFNQETTLSGRTILKDIQKAKEKGFKIHLRYVGVENLEIAKERVAARVLRGGHGVDESTIERRYNKTLENLIAILPICDTIHIYDNSGAKIRLIAWQINGEWYRTDERCLWFDKLNIIP